jgi:hypothetical protein
MNNETMNNEESEERKPAQYPAISLIGSRCAS